MQPMQLFIISGLTALVLGFLCRLSKIALSKLLWRAGGCRSLKSRAALYVADRANLHGKGLVCWWGDRVTPWDNQVSFRENPPAVRRVHHAYTGGSCCPGRCGARNNAMVGHLASTAPRTAQPADIDH